MLYNKPAVAYVLKKYFYAVQGFYTREILKMAFAHQLQVKISSMYKRQNLVHLFSLEISFEFK